MRTKVVYNGDYGGYSIPEEVRIKYNEIAGTNYENFWNMEEIPRHDKLLVQLVEEFLQSDKKDQTDLAILEIDSNRYLINEYDGWESVVEPNDIDWIEVE
jgi:hypothetical protein